MTDDEVMYRNECNESLKRISMKLSKARHGHRSPENVRRIIDMLVVETSYLTHCYRKYAGQKEMGVDREVG